MTGHQPNAQHTGDISEMEVALSYKRAGYTILWPHGHQTPYDFVAERDAEFVRVQVKSGRLDGGSIDVHVCTWKSDGSPREYDKSEIDVFGVYCAETDEVYIVPVAEAPKQNMRLRVEEGQNQSHVRRASRYRAAQVLRGNLSEFSTGDDL